MKYLLQGLIIMLLAGCGSPSWEFSREIKLSDITPLGIVATDQGLWVSDVEGNRVILVDLDGKIQKAFSGFKRPMHIARHQDIIYVPEYINDTLKIIEGDAVVFMPWMEKLDGPAAIAVTDGGMAVADFYNNRVLFKKGELLTIIGKEGHQAGELYYPTDVEFYDHKIYVADAYNNRVQVFDEGGKGIQVIGEADGIRVATGIALSGNSIFVTDFDGNRILVYDLEGRLLQILNESLKNPTDIAVHQDRLYIANYGGNSILEFVRE